MNNVKSIGEIVFFVNILATRVVYLHILPIRALHLNSNPDYSQFIVGDEIAVIIIRIEKARMCDIHDRVSYWNVKDGFVPNDI
jgi:hypothetical protein